MEPEKLGGKKWNTKKARISAPHCREENKPDMTEWLYALMGIWVHELE